LIALTRTTVTQARQVAAALENSTDPQAQRLAQQFGEFIPLVEQAIEQTVRRVLNGESVPASAKVVSLFEPHTQIICRGKAPPHETEFGHKVNYAEADGGFIVDWTIVAHGNPPDDTLLPSALRHHLKLFGHAPEILAGDRGLFSPENEDLARRLGIKRIAIPQPGHRTPQRQTHEKQKWFKKGQRFRNGIEGRISVVRRTVQLTRCPNHRRSGLERWVGWGIIVANLVVMARKLRKRRRGANRQAK